MSGLYPPACTLVVPASNPGWNGRGLWHGEPLGPLVTSNVELELAGSLLDHGVNDAVLVYDPHDGGVLNGARLPPKKCSLASSNGTCGLFGNTVTICPVRSSSLTSPASFTLTPSFWFSASRYSATRLPNGF